MDMYKYEVRGQYGATYTIRDGIYMTKDEILNHLVKLELIAIDFENFVIERGSGIMPVPITVRHKGLTGSHLFTITSEGKI